MHYIDCVEGDSGRTATATACGTRPRATDGSQGTQGGRVRERGGPTSIPELGAVDLGAELGAEIHGAELRHVGCHVSGEVDLVLRSRRHGPRRRNVKARRHDLWRRAPGSRNRKRFAKGSICEFHSREGPKSKKAGSRVILRASQLSPTPSVLNCNFFNFSTLNFYSNNLYKHS